MLSRIRFVNASLTVKPSLLHCSAYSVYTAQAAAHPIAAFYSLLCILIFITRSRIRVTIAGRDLVNDLMLGTLKPMKSDLSHKIVAPVLDTNVVCTNGGG